MKQKIVTIAISALSSAVILSSCQNSVNIVEKKDKEAKPTTVAHKQVISDTSVEKRLKIEAINSEYLPTGLLKVQVTLKNTSKSPFKFSYRFNWFNKKGMKVESPTNTWIEKDVLGGDTVHLSSVAPNPQCSDFSIKLMALE